MSGLNSWIIRLETKVSKLRYDSRIESPKNSKKELDKCYALLEQIYTHALMQKNSISPFLPRIDKVQDHFTEIQDTIERKKNSFWKVVLRKISSAIFTIVRILGLGDWGVFLVRGDRPRLLN